MKRRTKSLAAIMAGTIFASSVLGSTASADFSIWWGDGSWSSSDYIWGSDSSNTDTTDVTLNCIPRTIYMTSYTSNANTRIDVAQSILSEASVLLNRIEFPDPSLENVVEKPSFVHTSLVIESSEYDNLAKVTAEDGSVILTFNSKTNLDNAIKKITAEEQTLLDNALKPFITYIDNVLAEGSFTKVTNANTDEQKATKIANEAWLKKAKATLSHTYDKSELFSAGGDDSVLYQTLYLTSASSNGVMNTSISNKNDLNGFPRIVVDGNVIEWSDIEHVDVTSKNNNSWWFALKDGSTLGRAHYNAITREYCWLKGMMVPNFTPVIAFGADYRDWQPYETVTTSSSSNGNSGSTSGNSNTGIIIYYNSRYYYASEFVYAVTDGTNTIYYPNPDYADAACAYGDYYIARTISSTHSAEKPYFCFINGKYYSSLSASPYPDQTALMSIPDTSSAITKDYFYVHDGVIYDYSGNNLGKVSERGYTTNNTWFSINTGRFYPTPMENMTGFYVSASDVNDVAQTDPYYEYWHAKLLELEKEIDQKLAELAEIEKRLEEAKKEEEKNNQVNNNTSSTEAPVDDTVGITARYKTSSNSILYVTGTELADIRANYESVTLKCKGGIIWTIESKNIKTPKITNLRVIYRTKNIPDSIRKAMLARKDIVAISQLTIGENVAWGLKASVRLRYAKKYANYNVSLYRYDTKSGSLIHVDDATIGKTGYVTFENINHGGDYLVTFG